MFAQVLPYVVTAIVSIFGSAGFWKLLQWRAARRDKAEEGTKDYLRNELAALREEHKTCQSELAELRERVGVIEHHHASYLPRWIKDATRRLVWVNDKAFISIFAMLDVRREEVNGKTFAELLQDQVASAEIERLDTAALAHHGVAASNIVRLHPLLPPMVIVTVADIGREGEVVYEGYAYLTNDPMIAAGQGAGRQRLAIGTSAANVIDGERAG